MSTEREALHQISLCSQNSMSSKEECGRIARAALAEKPQGEPAASWVPVSERMPESGVTVLACYMNSAGNWRRIRAAWVRAHSSEASSESDWGEYDEETDCYYDPEGWYEQIDNWPEYTACTVDEGRVTHWMPLPAPPKEKPHG